MLRNNHKWLVPFAGLALSTTAVLAAPVHADTTIRSIRSFQAAGSTLIDFALDGKTYATIASTTTRVNISLAGTHSAPDLAQHIDVDGSVGRMTVDPTACASDSTTVSIALAAPMNAALVPAGDPDTIRLCLQPVSTSPTGVVSMVGGDVESLQSGTKTENETSKPEVSPSDAAGAHLYNLDAFDSDAASLFKSLAVQSKTDIVLVGNITSKVTIHFVQTPIDRAIDMLAKAADLSYIRDGGAYIVGSDKDLKAEYPEQTPEYNTSQKVYFCKYVDAASLATSLISTFDKNLLHVSIGATERTTDFSTSAGSNSSSAASSLNSYPSASTSSTGNAVGSMPMSGGFTQTGQSASTGLTSREVILYGDESIVDQAYALAQELDRRRQQIKIDVQITDVSLGDLKQLGIQWAFPQFGVHEGTPNGISFGSFKRDPLNFEATMQALEDSNKAKLLAAPSIALLDGEQGYILIGQRVSYPLLTGYTTAQTPIFSVGQEQVGIYLQVQGQMVGNDEIMLSVYPQVSFITGYLNVNGASYPQVSTREQQTTVRVHSGGKVIIGGLINDQDIRDTQSVPILSKIPLFGELFKYRNNNKTRDEVIVTITPTVVEE